MNKFLKNVFVYLMIIICAIWMIDSYSASTVPKTDITYTAFMKHVQQDEVKQVTIVENVISGKLKDGSDFTTVVPNDDSLIPTLRARDIEIKAELPPEPPWWMTVVSELLPIVVDDGGKRAFADTCYCCCMVFYDAADAGRRWRPRRDEFRQEPCTPLRRGQHQSNL